MRVSLLAPAVLTLIGCASGPADQPDSAIESLDDHTDTDVAVVDTDLGPIDTDDVVDTDLLADTDSGAPPDTDDSAVVGTPDTDSADTDTQLADTDDTGDTDTQGSDTDTPLADTDHPADTDTQLADTDDTGDTDLLCAPDPFEPDDGVVDLGAGAYTRTDATVSVGDRDVIHVHIPAGCATVAQIQSDAGPSDQGTFSILLTSPIRIPFLTPTPLNVPYSQTYAAYSFDVDADLIVEAGPTSACITYSVSLSCEPPTTGDTDTGDTDVPPTCPDDPLEDDAVTAVEVASTGGDFSRVLTGSDVDSFVWHVMPGCSLGYEYTSGGSALGTESLTVVVPAISETLVSTTLGTSSTQTFTGTPVPLDVVVQISANTDSLCLPYDLRLFEDCGGGDTDVPPFCADDAYEPDNVSHPSYPPDGQQIVDLDISSGTAGVGPRTLTGDDVDAVRVVVENGCPVMFVWDAPPVGSPGRAVVLTANGDVVAVGNLSAGMLYLQDSTGLDSETLVLSADGDPNCLTYTLSILRACPWDPPL